MTIPSRLINLLNESNVRYEIVHHPVAFTAQELSAIEGVRGHEHAKVVMVKGAEKCFMAVLASDLRVDLDKLGQLTGGKLTKATEIDFKVLFPDCEIGTMPPFGGLYQVETFVDRGFTQNDRIAFEAGTHSDAIKMTYADYERLAKPTIADFAVKVS